VKCLFDGRRIGSHFASALFKFLKDVSVDLQVGNSNLLIRSLFATALFAAVTTTTTTIPTTSDDDYLDHHHHIYCYQSFSLQDLQDFDPQTATSLRWLLATSEVKGLGLHFEDVGLSHRGAVTERNKADYIRMKAQHILFQSR